MRERPKPQPALHMLQKLHLRGLRRTVTTYNAAISACEKGQKPQQALHMLQELQLRGLLRTVITYNAAISACEKGQKATPGAAYGAEVAAQRPPAQP